MKPIIVDMKDMSDSSEVYHSKPNPFLIYFIYIILALLIGSILWMYFFKIDIVVKGDGVFKSDNNIYEVSCKNSGKVNKCNIVEGQYVNKGDTLLTMDDELLNESIESYSKMLEDINQRIVILNAYSKSLDGDVTNFESLSDNKFYEEMVNRKKLLDSKVDSSDENSDSQKEEYKKNVEDINLSINQYEDQVLKLNQTKECIKNRNNSFDSNDSYYNSIVNSYISNYNATSTKYDNQITQNNNQKLDIENQINNYTSDIQSSSNISNEDLEKNKKKIIDTVTSLEDEKNKVLQNLELEQITNIEQQIETTNNTKLTLKSNLASIQAKIDSLDGTSKDNVQKVELLTEKSTIASELIKCQDTKTDYENTLMQFNIKNQNATLIASCSGYISMNQEIKNGMYLEEGYTICSILPEKNSGYYANIYLKNSDIAKVKCGQKVKFEIAAYPSSEYGYFTGKIETISKDIKVDQSTGNAYYLVKVKCNKKIVKKNGKKGNILNGMACRAKIVVEDKSVLRYLLEKIDLLD